MDANYLQLAEPLALSIYEEYTHQTKFTGAISETPNMTIKIVRVGKMVTLTLKTLTSGVSAFTSALYSMTNFPERFFPDASMDTIFPIPINEGASVMAMGRLSIPANTGMLYITRANDADFIAGQSYGFEAFSVSWVMT